MSLPVCWHTCVQSLCRGVRGAPELGHTLLEDVCTTAAATRIIRRGGLTDCAEATTETTLGGHNRGGHVKYIDMIKNILLERGAGMIRDQLKYRIACNHTITYLANLKNKEIRRLKKTVRATIKKICKKKRKARNAKMKKSAEKRKKRQKNKRMLAKYNLQDIKIAQVQLREWPVNSTKVNVMVREIAATADIVIATAFGRSEGLSDLGKVAFFKDDRPAIMNRSTAIIVADRNIKDIEQVKRTTNFTTAVFHEQKLVLIAGYVLPYEAQDEKFEKALKEMDEHIAEASKFKGYRVILGGDLNITLSVLNKNKPRPLDEKARRAFKMFRERLWDISNRFEGRANTVTFEGKWGKNKIETMPDSWVLNPLAIADTTDMWNESAKRMITKVEGKVVCDFYVGKNGATEYGDKKESERPEGPRDGMCPSQTQDMVSNADRKRMADKRKKVKWDEDLELMDNLRSELKDGGKLDHKVRWITITRKKGMNKEHGLTEEEKKKMKNVTKREEGRPRANERDMDEHDRETFRERLKEKILEMECAGKGEEWGMYVPLVASAEVRSGLVRSIDERNKEERAQMEELTKEYEGLMLRKKRLERKFNRAKSNLVTGYVRKHTKKAKEISKMTEKCRKLMGKIVFRTGQKLVVADVHKIRNKVEIKEKPLEGVDPNYIGKYFNEVPLAKNMELEADVKEEYMRIMSKFDKLDEAGRKMVTREPTHEALVKLIKEAPPSVAASSFGETMASLKILKSEEMRPFTSIVIELWRELRWEEHKKLRMDEIMPTVMVLVQKCKQKPGKHLGESYRAVALYNCVQKVMQRLINQRINELREMTGAWDPTQLGVQKGDGVMALMLTLRTVIAMMTDHSRFKAYDEFVLLGLDRWKCFPSFVKSYLEIYFDYIGLPEDDILRRNIKHVQMGTRVYMINGVKSEPFERLHGAEEGNTSSTNLVDLGSYGIVECINERLRKEIRRLGQQMLRIVAPTRRNAELVCDMVMSQSSRMVKVSEMLSLRFVDDQLYALRKRIAKRLIEIIGEQLQRLQDFENKDKRKIWEVTMKGVEKKFMEEEFEDDEDIKMVGMNLMHTREKRRVIGRAIRLAAILPLRYFLSSNPKLIGHVVNSEFRSSVLYTKDALMFTEGFVKQIGEIERGLIRDMLGIRLYGNGIRFFSDSWLFYRTQLLPTQAYIKGRMVQSIPTIFRNTMTRDTKTESLAFDATFGKLCGMNDTEDSDMECREVAQMGQRKDLGLEIHGALTPRDGMCTSQKKEKRTLLTEGSDAEDRSMECVEVEGAETNGDLALRESGRPAPCDGMCTSQKRETLLPMKTCLSCQRGRSTGMMNMTMTNAGNKRRRGDRRGQVLQGKDAEQKLKGVCDGQFRTISDYLRERTPMEQYMEVMNDMGIKRILDIMHCKKRLEALAKALKYRDMIACGKRASLIGVLPSENEIRRVAEKVSKTKASQTSIIEALREDDNRKKVGYLKCKECDFTVKGIDVRCDGHQKKMIMKVNGNIDVEYVLQNIHLMQELIRHEEGCWGNGMEGIKKETVAMVEWYGKVNATRNEDAEKNMMEVGIDTLTCRMCGGEFDEYLKAAKHLMRPCTNPRVRKEYEIGIHEKGLQCRECGCILGTTRKRIMAHDLHCKRRLERGICKKMAKIETVLDPEAEHDLVDLFQATSDELLRLLMLTAWIEKFGSEDEGTIKGDKQLQEFVWGYLIRLMPSSQEELKKHEKSDEDQGKQGGTEVIMLQQERMVEMVGTDEVKEYDSAGEPRRDDDETHMMRQLMKRDEDAVKGDDKGGGEKEKSGRERKTKTHENVGCGLKRRGEGVGEQDGAGKKKRDRKKKGVVKLEWKGTAEAVAANMEVRAERDAMVEGWAGIEELDPGGDEERRSLLEELWKVKRIVKAREEKKKVVIDPTWTSIRIANSKIRGIRKILWEDRQRDKPYNKDRHRRDLKEVDKQRRREKITLLLAELGHELIGISECAKYVTIRTADKTRKITYGHLMSNPANACVMKRILLDKEKVEKRLREIQGEGNGRQG